MQEADLVTGHTQSAQVVQLAHATARVDWDDVVSMPRIALQHLHHRSILRLMHVVLGTMLGCRASPIGVKHLQYTLID